MFFLIIGVGVFAGGEAHAQAVSNGFVETLADTFVNAAAKWESALQNVAVTLFQGLVVIEIVWTVGWALVSGMEIAGLLGLIARQLITIGFFYWLLQGGATFPNAIINSFGQAAGLANQAAGGNVVTRPEDIIALATSMAQAVWKGLSLNHPALDLLLVIAGIVILCVMVCASATLLEVIVEAALVAYAGVLLLGFGGTEFTRNYATSYLRWAIAIGVKKLFVLLILGLGVAVMTNLSNAVANATSPISISDIAITVAVPLLFWRLAEKLPHKAHDVICGSSPHHPLGLLRGAAQVGQAAAAAAVAATGAGAAVSAAYNLAQAQLSGGSGGRGGAGAGGEPGGSGGDGGGRGGGGGSGATFGQTATQAARNLGNAARTGSGMRFMGDINAKLMHQGWRIAESLDKETDKIRGEE